MQASEAGGRAAGAESLTVAFEPVADNPIRHVIAMDGGYKEVAVRTEYPSSAVAFFQIGALVFGADLMTVGHKPFIEPEDMARSTGPSA